MFWNNALLTRSLISADKALALVFAPRQREFTETLMVEGDGECSEFCQQGAVGGSHLPLRLVFSARYLEIGEHKHCKSEMLFWKPLFPEKWLFIFESDF